jgi:hypothetical protein
MASATSGDALGSEYEMVRVQRKRAATHPEAADSVGGSGGRTAPESGVWQVVENADSSNDDSHEEGDDDRKKKSAKPRPKLRVGPARGGAPPLGWVRYSLGTVLSAQAVVAFGIVWCGVVAMLLFKWLWFYKAVSKPLEKWLGQDLRPEGEPIAVGLAIVAPFVATGVVFYVFRPPSPRLKASDIPFVTEKARAWRRRVCSGRVDSIDIFVIAVFVLVQVNALIGKLFIDQFNGKIAKSGYLNRTGRALGMNGFYAVVRMDARLCSLEVVVEEVLTLYVF